MVIIDTSPRETRIRVGTANTVHRGPLGTGQWQRETIQTRRGPKNLFFQEVRASIVEHARVRVHDDIEIPCHRASPDELILLDATFPLVPPSHLRLVNERKPEGFLISATAGLSDSLSYMGGLNATADYSTTPEYDERRLILITHGALWENRELGMCPTVLHEIGHVLTHRGEINYAHFPEERRRQLEGTTVSRNPGRLEALCNAYMYLLCYGSASEAVRNYGSRPASNQKDRVTRDALRRCRAFRGGFLDQAWQQRFQER